VPALLAALHVGLALLAFVPAPHPGGDNAVYLALARSLLAGEGYRDLYAPGAPAHVQFPPGFPALLAAGLALGLRAWAGIKLVVVAASAAAVALTWAWARRRGGPRAALAAAFLVAVSPGVLELSHWELSDVPFWALTMAALLGWERLGRGRTRRLVFASLATAAAYLTRSAGLPLLGAAALWLAWRRRWKQLGLYLLATVPPAAAWWLWTRAQRSYLEAFWSANPYAPGGGALTLSGVFGRIVENLGLYLGRLFPTLLWGSAGTLFVVLGGAVAALALYGWARHLRRPGVAEAWFPLYAGMLLLWTPQWAGERLALPLLPLVLLYAGEGVVALARLMRAASPRAVATAAAAVFALACAPGLAAKVGAGSACTRAYLDGDAYACLSAEWHDFFAMAEVARDRLPDGAVVVSRKPALFHAESGLRGRTFPLARDPGAFFRAAEEAGARYVVLDYLDEVSTQYLTPILIRRPRAFCVIEALGPERAVLFGIAPGAARMPDQRADPGAAEVDVGFKPCGREYLRTEVR
jgi:4-amino-4-deoxy-L-arabinose transferase-like glycosyltransferase